MLTLLVFAGCDFAMDELNVTNGSKYIVTSKKKKSGDYHYTYRLVKEEYKWYNYWYIDTAAFNVGDTLVVNISKK